MKKLLAMLLALTMILSMAACGTEQSNKTEEPAVTNASIPPLRKTTTWKAKLPSGTPSPRACVWRPCRPQPKPSWLSTPA